MTVVRPNSIAGINSITVQTGQALNIHDASGNLIRNITSSSGISTFASVEIAKGTGDLKVGVSTFFVDQSTGKIGIGTAVPAGLLEIDAASTTEMIMLDVAGVNFAKIGHNAASGVNVLDVRSEGHMRVLTGGNNERLRVTSSGLVGINSVSPSKLLEVQGTDVAFRLKSTVATGRIGMEFYDTAAQKGFLGYPSSGNDQMSLQQNEAADFYCYVNGADRLRIRADGRVAIASSVAVTGVCTAAQFLPTECQIANRNMVINGDMQVSQRGSQVTGLTASAYATVDRFKFIGSNGGTYTCDTVSDSVDNGLRKAFKFTCTTADNAGENNLANADGLIGCEYRFEGQDVQRIQKGFSSAKQVTLSFWVKSNLTGTYNVELKDNDNSRNCGFNYTVSSSATWEKKTIVFPADTTGTMDNDNAQSLTIQWWLAAGNNYRTGGSAQTTWGSTTKNKRAYNNVSLSKATSNYWQITGVQLEVGAAATPFEHRSFNEQLDMCHRYYQLYRSGSSRSLGLAFGYATTEVDLPVSFIKQMRTTPTLVQGSGSSYYQLQGGVGSGVYVDGAWSFQLAGEQGGNMYSTNLSGTLTVGSAYHARQMNSSAYVHFNAEL